jgi:ankyrin repeat protein
MNVDVLANNPSWTTYFFIAVPVFAVVMTVVIILKRLKDATENSPGVVTGLLKLIRWCRSKSKISDEECQISSSIVDPRYNKHFIDAILAGNNAMVKHLLSLGIADVNFHDGKMTGLQYAATAGNEDLFQLLLENGANVNAPVAHNYGRTALQAASEGGHLAVVDRLLEKGANLNAEAAQNRGRAALQAASEGGHLAVVDRLLEKGANINAEAAPIGGRTALQAASEGGHLMVVDRLLENGANVNAEAADDG